MPSMAGLFGAVICVSLLEGIWTWFLATALSEVAGQGPPSPVYLGGLLFAAWLTARMLELRSVDLVVRRRLLVAAGMGVALTAGTMHSGLVLPVQLIFGRPTPDLRGAGIALLLLSAYLWARGLALARGIDRGHVGNHVIVSAAGLIATLLFLPLTETVQRDGVLVVAMAFLLGSGSLALLQIAGTDSRRLTPVQWTALIASTGLALVAFSTLVSGAFTLARVDVVHRFLSGAARTARPVTDALLLAAGHLAEILAHIFRALGQLFGADEAWIRRAMERAEQQRPQVEEFDPGAPPEIMTLAVALFLTALALAVMAWGFARLVGQRRGPNAVLMRRRASLGGRGALDALRAALGRRWRFGEADGPAPSDDRAAIRHHYRRLQTLMARAHLPRGPSQTPAEYERILQTAMPQFDRTFGEITSAYVLARYAPADTRLPQASRIGQAVDELRAALRSSDQHPPPRTPSRSSDG